VENSFIMPPPISKEETINVTRSLMLEKCLIVDDQKEELLVETRDEVENIYDDKDHVQRKSYSPRKLGDRPTRIYSRPQGVAQHRPTRRKFSVSIVFAWVVITFIISKNQSLPITMYTVNNNPWSVTPSRKNTMIIAASPTSDIRLQAIWSQLECLTASIDRIVLAVPDDEFSHNLMPKFIAEVNSSPSLSLHGELTVQYYKNDRYDAGLWCDALQEENAGISDGDATNYILINDSLLAIRPFDDLLGILFEKELSMVSLNFWNATETEDYWVESAARAFTPYGIHQFRKGVCEHLDDEVGQKCNDIRNPTGRKRCIVEYTEIDVAKSYNRSQITGLYPGRGENKHWIGDIPFWTSVLVDQMNFPFAKVSHGFLEFVPEKHKYGLYSCIIGMPPDEHDLLYDKKLT
jgi:hypothetical protein